MSPTTTETVKACEIRVGDHVWIGGHLRMIQSPPRNAYGRTLLHHGDGFASVSADKPIQRVITTHKNGGQK